MDRRIGNVLIAEDTSGPSPEAYLEYAREQLARAFHGGELNQAAEVIGAAGRVGKVFGITPQEALDTNHGEDIAFDLTSFGGEDISSAQLFGTIRGINQTLGAYRIAAEVVLDDRHTQKHIQAIGRSVLANLVRLPKAPGQSRREEQLVRTVHGHIHDTIRNKRLSIDSESMPLTFTNSHGEVPEDHLTSMEDDSVSVEDEVTAQELHGIIAALPDIIRADDLGEVKVKAIITALAAGFSPEELGRFATEAQVTFARSYFAHQLDAPITAANGTETAAEPVRPKYHSEPLYKRDILLELHQVTQTIGSLRGVFAAMESAALTPLESAALLREFGYYAAGERIEEFCLNHAVTINIYLKSLQLAARKLQTAAAADPNALAPQRPIAAVVNEAAVIRAGEVRLPSGLIETVQALIAIEEGDPERFARFPLSEKHRALVMFAMEAVRRTGTVDIGDLRASQRYRSDISALSVILRTHAKLIDNSRVATSDTANRVTSGTARFEVINFPPERARQILADKPRLLKIYEEATEQEHGIYKPFTHHKRDLYEILDVLHERTPLEVARRFAERRGVSPEELLRQLTSALDQPKSLEVIARELNMDQGELVLWRRRLQLEGAHATQGRGDAVRNMAIRLQIPLSQVEGRMREIFSQSDDIQYLAEKYNMNVGTLRSWKQRLGLEEGPSA